MINNGENNIELHRIYTTIQNLVNDDFSNFQDFYRWSILVGFREGMTLYRIDDEKPYSITNSLWIKE